MSPEQEYHEAHYTNVAEFAPRQKEVCFVEPFGGPGLIRVNLTRWPNRWKRFWFFVFFGWRFEATK